MKKYFDFNGTATRSEYWAMQLLAILGVFLTFFLMGMGVHLPVFLVPALALGIATLWYSLSTTVRRIRDSGNNIWWILTIFIPYVSIIPAIVFGVLPTHKED